MRYILYFLAFTSLITTSGFADTSTPEECKSTDTFCQACRDATPYFNAYFKDQKNWKTQQEWNTTPPACRSEDPSTICARGDVSILPSDISTILQSLQSAHLTLKDTSTSDYDPHLEFSYSWPPGNGDTAACFYHVNNSAIEGNAGNNLRTYALESD